MLKFSSIALRKTSLLVTTPLLLNRSSFKPFSQQDEEELVRVIKTKPRHVLRHVRQQVWKSRKRELHFRSTVTHLMIVLQEFLRKKLLDPAQASQIMEGVLQECVVYSQHDMAHLLFRAFLRFRKYGCVVTVNSIRALFESYKRSDSSDLMLQLANEMKTDASLRPLCIAAYLFAGREEEAEALWSSVSTSTLTKDDFLALVAGYEKLKKSEKLLSLLDMIKDGNLPAADRSDVLSAILKCFYHLDDDVSFTKVLQHVVDQSITLDADTFAIILRQKMRRVTAPEEVEAVENDLKALGYVPDVTGNSIIITAYARLVHFGDRGSEELMLSKVDTLLSSIESRLKQGDPDLDISAAHIRAVIRGYGAAGKPESIKNAWSRMQYGTITKDVRIYNELFKWFALMGIVKDVLLLKEEMEEAQVNPDSATYTWIIRALGKFYPRHVDRVYNELRSRQVRPDIQLYTTLLGVLGDMGRMDDVQQLWAEMKKREESGTLQLTPITFAVLIRVHGVDVPKALQIYDECRQRNLHLHSHVQTSLIHALSNGAEGIEKVEEFVKTIETWDTNVYNVVLSTYSKADQKDKFLMTLEKMQADGIAMNDVTFGTLITAFSRWGDEGKVQDVIQLLKEHEGEISPTFYSVLASSLNRMGNPEGVSDAWNDLVASKLFPDTEVYNQFLSLYSRQHNIDKMQGVLDNMMKQVPPNPVTATTVLDVLGKSGRVSEMESLFEDMKTSPDTQPTSVTYHQLLNTYAKTGDIVKMEKVHSEFLSQGHTENAVTFNILMDGYGRSKNFEQLEEVLRRRKESGVAVDDLAYCIMLSSYGKARVENEVKRLFHEIAPAEAANHTLLTKRVVWASIDAFCRCGNLEHVEKCVELLQQCNRTNALKIGDCTGLIPYYCRLSEMEKAEGMMEKIQALGGEVTYNSLNAMARGYTRVGRFDKAVEILHKLMEQNWAPDATTALHLSGAFLKAGLHEQARQVIEWRRHYARAAGEQQK